MHKLPAIDLAVLAAYLAAMVAMGIRFARRGRSVDRFMAAGRAVPGWAVGLSIFGTFVSSISFLALPAKAYGGDWSPFVFSLSIPPAAWVDVDVASQGLIIGILSGIFFLRVLRRRSLARDTGPGSAGMPPWPGRRIVKGSEV